MKTAPTPKPGRGHHELTDTTVVWAGGEDPHIPGLPDEAPPDVVAEAEPRAHAIDAIIVKGSAIAVLGRA